MSHTKFEKEISSKTQRGGKCCACLQSRDRKTIIDCKHSVCLFYINKELRKLIKTQRGQEISINITCKICNTYKSSEIKM